jgi:hypothetical protein
MLAGRKKEGEREEGKYQSPLHPCMRTREWNSLCWPVKREREEKGRREVALW